MIAVLASGNGTNFQALAEAFFGQISLLICNVKNAPVIKRAANQNIPCEVVPHQNFATRDLHEKELVNILSTVKNLKIVVLAGYMRILTPFFFDELSSKLSVHIINLHPAHLDQYKGAYAYAFAVKHKFPRWGISVHEVTHVLDSGKLIRSIEIPVYPYEDEQNFKNRAAWVEHQILIEAVKKIIFK